MTRPKIEEKWIIYADASGKEWAENADDECPLCVATFPHRHSLREDGTFGTLMQPVDVRMRDKLLDALGWQK